MQEYHYDNLKAFLDRWQENEKYFQMLNLMAQLSKLFSDSEAPYLDYRLAENIFCRYYDAQNDARSCTAYDARLNKIGIGIKTFLLKGTNKDYSVEKIAEFNKLRPQLVGLNNLELAKKIAEFRNDRMQFANNQYDVTETQYHVVGRFEGTLRIFNTPYEEVDVNHLHITKDDDTSCVFNDEKNEYTFNKSKSVLLKRFNVPQIHKDIHIEMLKEPLILLEEFFSEYSIKLAKSRKFVKGVDYVILPLYSYTKALGYYVPPRSGLNQFNAGGRKRNDLEVYIPVPKAIHNSYPDFFPDRDTSFKLHLPDSSTIDAKICQDGGKALMSNPNSALGQWILRKVLKKDPWEIVTMDDLNRLGFDSVCVEKIVKKEGNEYRISFNESLGSYRTFMR